LKPRISTPDINGLQSLVNLKAKIRSILSNRRDNGNKSVRFHIGVKILFQNSVGPKNDSREFFISGPPQTISSAKGIDGFISKTISELKKKIEEYQERGSVFTVTKSKTVYRLICCWIQYSASAR
jgi:hypothetical protein